MDATGGEPIVRLRCSRCGRESFEPAVRPGGPCAACGGEREVLGRVADRRSGQDRRSPARLQRRWDYDPRSWFDRRRA